MAGTRRLERFQNAEAPLVFRTPVEEISPVMLAAARPSAFPTIPPPASLPRHERARDREESVERLRTRLARKFTTLADEVTAAFDEFRIGAGSWTVELTAPDGMSTKGGKHALQYLRLRPTRQGHVVLIGGIVDPVAKTSELRDYEHMMLMYRARFGRDLEITMGEWEQFLRKAEVVLHEEEIGTRRTTASADIRRLAYPDRSSSKQKAAILALSVAVFLSAIVMWRVFVALGGG